MTLNLPYRFTSILCVYNLWRKRLSSTARTRMNARSSFLDCGTARLLLNVDGVGAGLQSDDWRMSLTISRHVSCHIKLVMKVLMRFALGVLG